MDNLVLFRNPLNMRDREGHRLPPGTRIIDWLVARYPDGCGGALRFFVNGRERPLDDLDYAVGDDDTVALLVCPAGTGFGEALLISLITAAIMTAVSIGLTMILAKPEAPAFADPERTAVSPVYSIGASNNRARVGEPVAVAYGEVLHTPDYAAQPYQFFVGNEQFTDILLCLGMGEYDVQQVLLGSSDVDALEGAVTWKAVAPSEHLQAPGNLDFEADFYENMITVGEVQDLDFADTGQTAGPFRISKANVSGRHIYIDRVFPAGVYGMTGSLMTPIEVRYYIEVYACDTEGAIGALHFSHHHIVTLGSNGQPWRETHAYDMGVDGLWAVKIINDTPLIGDGRQTSWKWTGLRMIGNITAPVIYGNSTLLCVRMQTTRGVAEVGASMIKVRMTRKLPLLGSGAPTPTKSPADVVCDILTNTDYGAARPLTEVDVERLTVLKEWWDTPTVYGFNAIYTGRTTVWEALRQCLVGFAAAPLPLGGIMSVQQDGIKPARTMLFSEQNIARDTFKLAYSFDDIGAPDGIEIEYRDRETFVPKYARYPTTADRPERVPLYGCTDAVQAGQVARLMWQRLGGNRRVVTFETEMEGLIPYPGDRAAVQHTLARWGQSGFVVGVEGLTLTLDRNLKWDDIEPPYFMAFRSEDGGISNMVEATRGATDDEALLAADPWDGLEGDWALNLHQEITHFVWGNGTTAIKDFLLTGLEPQPQGRVKVTGVYYDPAVYAGTLAFLANPVP